MMNQSVSSVETKIDKSIAERLSRAGHVSLGRLRPRRSDEISGSPWSIGCETIDRDYVDFSQTRGHLRDLGAKQARVQAGWAKCDPRGDGTFNWGWLDEIVDGCLGQGVRPWLQTSYGNPSIPGGGGIGLAEGIPTSETAIAAWDRWVDAMARRYAGRVDRWEIWNEPDNRGSVACPAYVELFVRTATILRSIQPRARIAGLALAGHIDYAREFIESLARGGSGGNGGHGGLLDELVFHFYPHNPDGAFDRVAQLGELLATAGLGAILRQGETGAPSETQKFMAMGQFEWSERKQAVWNLRRMLAHHARGIEMNLFQLADMQYVKDRGAIHAGRNPKGLLCCRSDKTVAYRKPSFVAAQSVFSLFDDRFELAALPRLESRAPFAVEAYAWTARGADRAGVVSWWRADDAPGLQTPDLERIGVEPVDIADPVLLDPLSGQVFALGSGAPDFAALPCLDSPLWIADRALLSLA